MLKLKRDAHIKELLKGAGAAFGIRLAVIVFGYLFMLLVTRRLGPRGWGIYSLFLVFLQISVMPAVLGLDTALVRFVAESLPSENYLRLKRVYKKATSFVFFLSILISLSCFFLSPWIAAHVFGKPYLSTPFRIASVLVPPFALSRINASFFQGLKKIVRFMLFSGAGITFLLPVFFVLFSLLSKSQLIPEFAHACGVLIMFLLSAVSVFLILKKLPSSGDGDVALKAMLAVSIPLFLSGSLSYLMNWTDTIMLGMFKSSADVGVYNVAVKLAALTSLTLFAVNTIAAPKFAEFWAKNDKAGLLKFARQAAKLVFFTSFPVIAVYVAFPSKILEMFGSGFERAAPALLILALAQLINAWAGSVGNILIMTGYEKFVQNVMLFGVVINALLNYLLIPKFGITGAAIASAVGMAFWNLAYTLKVRQTLGGFVFFNPFF